MAAETKIGSLSPTLRNQRICVFGVSPLRFLSSLVNGGPDTFMQPTSLAVHDGCLYVADSSRLTIEVMTLGGEFLRSFPHGDIGNLPVVVVVRPDGRLLVESDTGCCVLLMTQEGAILQVRPTRRIPSPEPHAHSPKWPSASLLCAYVF